MGWVEYTLGNQDRAIELNQRCLSMRDQLGQPALIAQVEANIGMCHVMACRYTEALAQLHPALAQLRDAQGPAAAGYGNALAHAALMAGDRGDVEQAQQWLAQARSAIESSGHFAMRGVLLTVEGMVCAFRGDWQGCGAAAAHVREVADHIDGAYLRQMAAALEGLALFHGSQDARGIGQLRASALFLESRGMGLSLSWNFASLAEALWLHDQPQKHWPPPRARSRAAP